MTKTAEDLTPDDFRSLAVLLSEKMVAILRSARERSMTPPFDLQLTSANDAPVFHFSVTEDGRLKEVSRFPEQPLEAQFPLLAMITDANGKSMELTIRPDISVQ